MKAIVVYESVYGNTRAIAEAIAEGLPEAVTVAVSEVGDHAPDADILIVGGPTHMHGLATARSRHMAATGAHEDGSVSLEPNATAQPGLREWLRDLEKGNGARAASFDTRLDRSPWLTGVAARGIARRLRHHGYEVLSTQSFLVEESEGPLADGELERARRWGAELSASFPAAGAAA